VLRPQLPHPADLEISDTAGLETCAALRDRYFFGKFGSALTSSICLVWRSLWAAMKSSHS
jgi:hypothetical protein